MSGLIKRVPRRVMIAIHDLVATAVAILASFYIRFEEAGLSERRHALIYLLPAILLYAAFVYWFFQLSRPKWRFTSLPELKNIFVVATVMALSVLALDYLLVSPYFYGTFFFGKITIALYWFLQVAFLSGPRIAYRYFRYARTQYHNRGPEALPTLILGVAADAEVLLRLRTAQSKRFDRSAFSRLPTRTRIICYAAFPCSARWTTLKQSSIH